MIEAKIGANVGSKIEAKIETAWIKQLGGAIITLIIRLLTGRPPQARHIASRHPQYAEYSLDKTKVRPRLKMPKCSLENVATKNKTWHFSFAYAK